ncbi:MAG: hypothetical protein J5715_08685 [Clostridiales bacterium]|nr:hypothetical protein [Clostridiales bacterium]MBO4580214.1 hypothetical protein [Clostridiales bacterium]
MNEENVKLAKIKKSSSVGKKVTNILAIIVIVATIILLATGIAFIAGGDQLEDKLAQAAASGTLEEPSNKFMYASTINIEMFNPNEIKTSVPALKVALEARPYTIGYGIYMIAMCIPLIIAAVVLKILASGFATIEKEDNPFTPAVIKKVTIVMIILSVLLALTVSFAYGAVGAIATWLIRSVFDYGRTLQIQSDETL